MWNNVGMLYSGIYVPLSLNDLMGDSLWVPT